MIIQNFSDLATSEKKRHCLEILDAGLAAADPADILPKFVKKSHIKAGSVVLDVSKYSRIYTVAFGKAGDSMTKIVNSTIPLDGGIIVIPKGSKSLITGKKFQIFNSGHPKPDKTSVKAARAVVKFLKTKRCDDLVIFLVSGGASALLALPDDITLDDKVYMTDILLRSGATIQEINCVRKHLSKIKGGRLVSDMKCTALALVMSDVEGDDLSSIASGTTFRDETKFEDAVNIIRQYKLERKTPATVWNILGDGLSGVKQETPKTALIPHHIIANNSQCLEAMAKKATSLGYNTDTMQIFGNIKEAVKKILTKEPTDEMDCLIFGGEPTVEVIGNGSGGRNHEIVLRLLKNTQKSKKMVIASVGTDGIDGSTIFAGAITDNAKTDMQEIKDFLRNSDSGRFFQKRSSNILTGFTHSNLMDVGVILR
ncbi:MAG: DUF4147 domain-containing protein [Thaumarchaeota archaeon]|nr:DUF4147 domain-containing protein [Nitrososphaerota archaeon]